MPLDRLKTLYLDGNGVGRTIILVDTVLRGVLGYRNGDRPPKFLQQNPKANLLFAELRDVNAPLSYIGDWRDAFLRSQRLDVEVCNINNLVHLAKCLLRIRRYDLIVVSHAAAGDDMTILSRVARFLPRRRGKLVVFIGNEYDILDEKIAFMRETGAEYVCSQLPIEAARYLYAECDRARVVEMPHALNPRHYRELKGVERTTDIGFVGDIYWPFVGDRERTDLIEWFEANGAAAGLSCDIRKQRLPREAWNLFLNGCKGIIGAESGTYYLNDRGRLLERARAYNLFENRDAAFDEVFDRFYRGQPREVSGKSVSSRHFEPIGSKTCQLLLAGHYNGILKPDEHYIPIKRDLSDVREAIAKFRDDDYRRKIAETAFDYAMAGHTYDHRVAHLLSLVD
jgi:hypothetical protein